MGLAEPYGLAVTPSEVFVSLVTPGYVAKYDRQGATQFVIEGLRHPVGLALSGPFNELFVASGDGVGKFNAKTGAAIKRDFITGCSSPKRWRCGGETSSFCTPTRFT